jgi:uncharacterized protein (TIGR03437 family)
VVPFEAALWPAAFVTVQGEGTIGPVKLPVVAAAPGVFTTNGSGKGQGAILNQDGTINSSSNPAARGSVISVFMTGAGAMTPYIAVGSLGPLSPPFPKPVQGIAASIGTVNAPVMFVGQAPGLIAGAVQLNLQIPSDAPRGATTLTVYVGGYVSQLYSDVSVQVR